MVYTRSQVCSPTCHFHPHMISPTGHFAHKSSHLQISFATPHLEAGLSANKLTHLQVSFDNKSSHLRFGSSNSQLANRPVLLKSHLAYGSFRPLVGITNLNNVIKNNCLKAHLRKRSETYNRKYFLISTQIVGT